MINSSEQSIKRLVAATIMCIAITIIGIVAITFQLIAIDKLPENFGTFGDAMGGVLNPIIAIGAALLTFLAFYMQIIANEEIKNQFKTTQDNQHADFLFNNYKSQLNLFINEFNNFNISYHNNKMITNINEINKSTAKKYNFVGLQAIQLFFIEFFRDKKEKELSGSKKLRLQDSYFGIYLTLTNLIVYYCSIFESINKSELNDEYRSDLESLMTYIYFSKLVYIFEILSKEKVNDELRTRITILREHYKIVDDNDKTLEFS